VRASAGGGFFAPTPFTEETEVIGLSRLAPLTGVVEERARSVSLDVGGVVGALELNATVFASEVRDPVALRESGGGVLELVNAAEPTRTRGGELLARVRRGPFVLTTTYTHLRSTELDVETLERREVPLTPRHAIGAVGMWEEHDVGRVGVELYYTGRQSLDDNPYRDTSRPYVVLGLLAERRLGPARIFVNAENLLDARQTRHDPLLLPARGRGGRWTTDAWAPLEGRAINGGVRLAFGGREEEH
jgi:iron complex outermembrane receptor protein